MRRVQVDLKDDGRPGGVPGAGRGGRRRRRELPARRGRPAGHRVRSGVGAQPGRRVLLDERLRPGRPARAVGRPRHRLPGRRRLPRHEHAGADGAPPLPGATVADAAAGGMQAALAITAALAGRATTGRGAYLDVSVAEGVLWLTSLAIDEQLALGGDIRPGPRRPVGPLRLLRHLRRVRREVAGGRRHRGQVLRQPLRRARVPGAGGVAVRRRRRSPRSGRRWPPPSPVGHGTSGSRSWPAPTPASPRCSRSPRWPTPAVRRPRRGDGGVAPDRRARSGSWRRCWPAWSGPAADAPALPDMTETDTEHLLKEAGVDGETVARWVAKKVVA